MCSLQKFMSLCYFLSLQLRKFVLSNASVFICASSGHCEWSYCFKISFIGLRQTSNSKMVSFFSLIPYLGSFQVISKQVISKSLVGHKRHSSHRSRCLLHREISCLAGSSCILQTPHCVAVIHARTIINVSLC